MIIKILAEGGNMQPSPALSQKLGPAGVNIGQVISKVNDATKNFQGLKVPVELNVNIGTKQFEIKIFSPPVSELLKKTLGIEKGSGAQKKMQVANASIEQIISVAMTKMPNLLCNDLKSAVKLVAGTCVSLGILIENKSAVEIVKEIEEKVYDKEIKQERTETPPEKKAKLEKYFSEIRTKQEALKKAEEVAKEAETESASKETKTPEKIEEKKEGKPASKKEKK